MAALLGTVLACGTADPPFTAEAVRTALVTPPALEREIPPRREAKEPPGVTLSDGVTQDEAIELALWNNAAFQEALAALGFARADLAQAGMLANPTLSLLFPLGPKQLEFAASLPIDLLWLRPHRMAVAQRDAERTAAALVQSGLDLVRDVRVASAELALATERVQVAEHSLALRSEIAQIAERRTALGAASELETAPARLDALQAEEELSRARLESRLARARWQSLLGLGLEVRELADLPPLAEADCRTDTSELWTQALAARPDLRAAELALEGAGARAQLAVAEIFTLTAILDANGSGTQGFESGPGVALAIPVFAQNQGGRTRARAELERATASYGALVQRAHLELVNAVARASEATRALRAVREEVAPRVEAALAQARAAHAAREQSYLAVLQATRESLAIRARECELVAESRRACAEVDRSVGRRLGES